MSHILVSLQCKTWLFSLYVKTKHHNFLFNICTSLRSREREPHAMYVRVCDLQPLLPIFYMGATLRQMLCRLLCMIWVLRLGYRSGGPQLWRTQQHLYLPWSFGPSDIHPLEPAVVAIIEPENNHETQRYSWGPAGRTKPIYWELSSDVASYLL